MAIYDLIQKGIYDERLDGSHKPGDRYKIVSLISNRPGAPSHAIVRTALDERDTIGDTLTPEEYDVIFFTQRGKCNGDECGITFDKNNPPRRDHIVPYCLGPLRDIIRRPVRIDHQPLFNKRPEVEREGFPELTPEQFVEMICRDVKDVYPVSVVNRIVFKRLD